MWVFVICPKNFVFGQILSKSAFMCLCVSVCLSVCLFVCRSIISKSSWPILMKLGRMMYNENISAPFKDEINWFGRTHTLAIWNVKIALSYKVLEKHITSLGPLKLSIPFKNCTYIYYILLLHVTKVYFFFLKKYSFFSIFKNWNFDYFEQFIEKNYGF